MIKAKYRTVMDYLSRNFMCVASEIWATSVLHNVRIKVAFFAQGGG